MALLTDKQQRNLLIALGLTDFATRSRLSTAAFDAIIATARKAAPIIGRAAVRQPVAMAGTARLIAMRHPVATGLAVAYVAYTQREKIQALLEQGYEIIEPAVDPLLELTAPGRQELFETMGPRPAPFIPGVIEQFRPKRKPSAFNRAVSAGMKAIKKSTSYGGKGKIKPAKKAFSVVVKLAAAKKKKKKAPTSGIRRKIWNAMKGLR